MSIFDKLGSAVAGPLGSIGISSLGSLGSTLTNAALSGVNRYVNRKSMEDQLELQNKYNKEMLDYQNQMNLENWNKQNEYNSPTEQRKRLAEAGLNENLMYDGYSLATADTVAAGSANGSASPRMNMQPMDFQDVVATRQLDMQQNLVDSQVNKNNAEANRINQTTPLDIQYKHLMNDLTAIEADFKKGTYDDEVAIKKSQRRQNELTEDLLVSQIGLTGTQARELNSRILKAVSDMSLNEQLKRESNSKIQLNEAQSRNLQALASLYVQQRILTEINAKRAEFGYDMDVATREDKLLQIVANAKEDFAKAIIELGKSENPAHWFGDNGFFSTALSVFAAVRAGAEQDTNPATSFNGTDNALNWLQGTAKRTFINKYK